MPKIAIFDLDSIIVDLLGPWLGWYNAEHDDSLTVADLATWKIEDHVKPHVGDEVYGFFKDLSRYESVEPFPGAAENLTRIHMAGIDIVVATATAGDTAHLKLGLIKKAMPWFDRHNLFIGNRKELLRGDFFIDDGPHNIERHRKAWPSTPILTIAHPYNQAVKELCDVYADGWDKPAKAWAEIADFIIDNV